MKKNLLSKELTIELCEKLLYCQEFLNPKAKKRKIKQWQPKLTPEEKILFDQEDILSAYQSVIANSCGRYSSIEPDVLPIHQFCRQGVYPGTSIQRLPTDDSQVPWVSSWFSYKPPYYTHPSLLKPTNEIDPESNISNMMWNTFDTKYNVDRRTANPAGRYPIDQKGYPLNPLGRTGLSGRGELKRWGVNYQTHLVIMCGTSEMKSGKEIFKYIMEKSNDNSYYRLPSTWTTGTNMNAITKTLKAYLADVYQSWNNFDQIPTKKIDGIIEHLTFVSTAYIDDSRNTDNAWLETSVCCYIQTALDKSISSNLQIDLNELFPDPSKTTFTWHRITRTSELLDSERDVIKLIAKRYKAYW